MDSYYDILGLKPGVSQAEIKKAYFRLIRQHSPETDPEQFQKIREAYEHLKKGEDVQEGPQFPPFEEPFAGKFMMQIESYRREGNHEAARDTCEEAWRLFGYDIFLYHLVLLQRRCGNTGKAVKNAELLVKREPGNKWFQRELALSYQARGYVNKAYDTFGKAYEMGCRDNGFLLMYAGECDERDEYEAHEKGFQVLSEIVRKDRKWTKGDIYELFDAYRGLINFNVKMQSSFFTEIVEGLCRKLEQYRIYAADYVTDVAYALPNGFVGGDNVQAEYKAGMHAFEILRQICRTENDGDAVRTYEQQLGFVRIIYDPRISDTLESAYEVYFDMCDMSERAKKFALTDIQLCMVEEKDEILEQAEILRQDYPDFYGRLEDFLKRLREERNIAYLKGSLMKTYRRLVGDFNIGLYYEKHPHEKHSHKEIIISDGYTETPYVRGDAKIGRNDPCPCGSGKKYKHCCMKK